MLGNTGLQFRSGCILLMKLCCLFILCLLPSLLLCCLLLMQMYARLDKSWQPVDEKAEGPCQESNQSHFCSFFVCYQIFSLPIPENKSFGREVHHRPFVCPLSVVQQAGWHFILECINQLRSRSSSWTVTFRREVCGRSHNQRHCCIVSSCPQTFLL